MNSLRTIAIISCLVLGLTADSISPLSSEAKLTLEDVDEIPEGRLESGSKFSPFSERLSPWNAAKPSDNSQHSLITAPTTVDSNPFLIQDLKPIEEDQLKYNNHRAPIVNNFFYKTPGGHHWGYESADGSRREEIISNEKLTGPDGTIEESLIVDGRYQYVGDDGKLYYVRYRSDKDGNQIFPPESV